MIGDGEGRGAVVSVVSVMSEVSAMSEVSVMSAEGRREEGRRGILMGGRA